MKIYDPGGPFRLRPPRRPAPLTCDVCGMEIGPDELAHLIDGFAVCPDCFFDFCFDYFSGSMMCGRDILDIRGVPEYYGRYV